MYCTLADLETTYGEQDLILLTDRTNKPPKTVDEDVVSRAIADVSGEIDMHLQTRYKLPLTSVPPILTRIACALTYAALHTRVSAEHPAKVAADDKRKLLRGVAKGELSLGVSNVGAAAKVNDNVQVSPGRNDWGAKW